MKIFNIVNTYYEIFLVNIRRKKRERIRKKIQEAQIYCEKELKYIRYKEYLKKNMNQKINKAHLPGISDATIYWLKRKGVKTSYDVLIRGEKKLKSIHLIGEKRAIVLMEWAESCLPRKGSFNWKEQKIKDKKNLRMMVHKHLRNGDV